MNHYRRFSHLQRQTKTFRPWEFVGDSVHEIREVHRFLPHDEIAVTEDRSWHARALAHRIPITIGPESSSWRVSCCVSATRTGNNFPRFQRIPADKSRRIPNPKSQVPALRSRRIPNPDSQIPGLSPRRIPNPKSRIPGPRSPGPTSHNATLRGIGHSMSRLVPGPTVVPNLSPGH